MVTVPKIIRVAGPMVQLLGHLLGTVSLNAPNYLVLGLHISKIIGRKPEVLGYHSNLKVSIKLHLGRIQPI